MKKFKKVLALSLAVAMGLSLAACGNNNNTTDPNAGNSEDQPATSDDSGNQGGNGETFYIYVWNNEYRNLMANYMPGYTADEDHMGGYMDDGTRIQFIENENANMNYQNKLDTALTDGSQVDMFLVEADYAIKYTGANAGVAMDVKDLGFTDDDLNNYYQYTVDVVTDGGVTRGVSWQAAAGFLVYNADIAEEVLGVRSSDEVQEFVKDWDAFEDTAQKMKDAGYTMVTDYQEGSRVFNADRSTPWVQDGVINVPAEVDEWAEMAKGWYDNGYMAGGGAWDGAGNWGNGMRENNFCYFGCTWFLIWSMDEQISGSDAKWNICQGPDAYYWGGTWLCAGANCTNKELAYEIMYAMTADPAVAEEIAKGDLNFPNNKEAADAVAAANFDVGRDWLEVDNYFGFCKEAADAIEVKNMTPYDQMIETYQGNMGEYFAGTTSKEDALKNFYQQVTEQWPSLSAPEE